MFVKIEGKRRRGQQRMRRLDSITDSMDMNGLNGHESEQTPGDSRRQKSLVCCSPWSGKELDVT